MEPPAHQHTISAIIPAFNEEKRISNVLAVLRDVPELKEIVVVDDGSQDSTAAEIEKAASLDERVKLVRHPTNLGKGQAIFDAYQQTQSAYIVLLDADLINMKPSHVRGLIEPVLAGKAEMTLGLFRKGRINTDFSHWLTPWLTGQRCVIASLLDTIDPASASGYGFETALTIAAHRQGCRTVRVPWTGVYHPPSEFHRGLGHGIRTRARMYSQIFQTWKRERGWETLRPKPLTITLALLAIILLLAGGNIVNPYFNHTPAVSISSMPILPLQQAQRILVVAPHPDDETIGAGGVIQDALTAGKTLKVVVITNGDGQMIAPVALRESMLPRARDYIRIGEQREQESLNALTTLGLPKTDAYYLGFPDSQLNSMWIADWTKQCPIRSRRTRTTQNPYPNTYRPNASYCGSELLGEIRSIIHDYSPDVIILPHPNDEHPDHRAAASYVRMAVFLESYDDPDYQPQLWGYLAHYGNYPQPRGYFPQQTLFPPPQLSGSGNDWYVLKLTPDQVKTKNTALLAYKTQDRLLGKYLDSFARTNELFADIPIREVSAIAFDYFPIRERGIVSLPLIAERQQTTEQRLLLGAADLVGFNIRRVHNQLWLTAETRTQILTQLDYRFILKSNDGRTWTMKALPPVDGIRPNSFTIQVDLTALDNPEVLGFTAQVRQGTVINQSAWHFIVLRGQQP